MPPATPEWQPRVLQDFHDALTNYLYQARVARRSAGETPDALTVRSLRKNLADLHHDFSRLFKEAPKNPSERTDILQGKAIINGKKPNASFGQSAIFLSDLLGINETYAANIFENACDASDFDPSWSKVKVAVALFHRRREHLLESLSLLITRFVPTDEEVVNEIVSVVEELFRQLSSLPITLPHRILESMAELSNKLSALEADHTLAGVASADQMKLLDIEENVIHLHMEELRKERGRLGDLLYYMSTRWRLTSAEILTVLRTLRKVEEVDATAVSLLCSLMLNLEPTQIHCQASITPALTVSDYNAIQAEIENSVWKVEGLQAVAWSQWTCFHHFCDVGEVAEDVVDDDFVIKAQNNKEAASRKWRDKIAKKQNVYEFICNYIVPFRRNKTEADLAGVTTLVMPEDEIRDAYIAQVERLVDAFITFMRWALKDIKQRDEDATRAADQADRKLASSTNRFATGTSPQKKDHRTAWEAFLFLLTILYRDRPDAAVSFWVDSTQGDMNHDPGANQMLEKHAFVRMASDVRTSRFVQAFMNMLASLATGKHSADAVHRKLNADPADSQLGSVLWTTFFASLNSAINVLGRENRDLVPHEIATITSFLRLLGQVVKYSYSARRTLCDDQHLRALYTLFWLLSSRVPVELKAALLDAISAFCVPIDDTYDIQTQVWFMLEQAQVVPTAGHNASLSGDGQSAGSLSQSRPSPGGIIYDLEEIESQNGTYPETLALLRLLDVLLHGNGNQQVAVFETLGAPDRLPGVRPYIEFVIEHIFIKITSRRFNDPDEKWEVLAACLSIFNKTLEMFDLSALLSVTDANGNIFAADSMSLGASGFGPQILHNAQMLGLHPAFQVTCSLLENKKFTSRLFDVISFGVAEVNSRAGSRSMCGHSVSLALQVILHVLRRQKAFLEILAPAILEAGSAEVFTLPASMGGIDHLLSFRPSTVIHIAEYIMCVDDEMCLLSVRILSILSQSAVYGVLDPATRMNRLLMIIQGASTADAVIAGFVKRLEMEENEMRYVSPAFDDDGAEPCENVVGAEAMHALELKALLSESWQSRPWPNPRPGQVHAVRMAILDLLLSNLDRNFAPSIAHFLLGYDTRASQRNTAGQDYARRNCLTAIVTLIRVCSPDSKGHGGDAMRPVVIPSVPLYDSHPNLAEKCYRLIHHLCVDDFMSAPTMLYLRNKEDFFFQQLQMMPVNASEDVQAGDDNVRPVLSKLLQRTWLMKAIALELHLTMTTQQRWHAQRLINLMYGAAIQDGTFVNSQYPIREVPEEDSWGIDDDDDADIVARSAPARFEVPLIKILEILNVMNFEEAYAGAAEVHSTMFPNVHFEVFRPGTLYDLAAVHHHLVTELRGMDQTPERMSEIKRILTALLSANQNQEIGAARWQCSQAWGQIVHTTLVRCFLLIPAEEREGIIFDILCTLLSKLESSRTSPLIAEGMSSIVLELLDKMQKDRLFQSLLQTSSLQAEPSTIRLPTDSLLHAVLHGILKGIVMAGSSIEMRGNLYIALMRFLQYTKPDELEVLQSGTVHSEDLNSKSSPSSPPTTRASHAPSVAMIPSRARLLQGIYAVISSEGDKLFETICRDAADGSGVWNIVAFAALDAVCELAFYSRTGRESSKLSGWVLEVMVNRNFLGQFVRAINREDDLALRGSDQNAIRFLTSEAGPYRASARNSDGALNAHLLFEMKTAFLLRLSFQHDGAQKLLEYGIIEALADCKFLDQRPGVEGFAGTSHDAF
ncbi:hypothetical protein HKX48_006396 [Thoreauomyces humboldtii]|nr:hypothetical protein HKX48_006396 [Thoreauomyces humboldtii]